MFTTNLLKMYVYEYVFKPMLYKAHRPIMLVIKDDIIIQFLNVMKQNKKSYIKATLTHTNTPTRKLKCILFIFV